MSFKNAADIFELLSKVCAVMLAAALALSTAATVVLLPLTVLFSLAAGNLRQKLNQILHNPASLVLLLFSAMFIVGIAYSTASWPDILLVLRKHTKFLLAAFLVPVFIEEKWRSYAIMAFLGGILVLVVCSYLREFGWFNYGTNGFVEVFKVSIEFNFLLAFAAYFCLFEIFSNKCCRSLWVIFLLLIVHTILFRSVGRSGYFVFGCLTILFFMQKLGWRGLVISFTSVILFFSLAYGFSPIFKDRVNAIFSDIKVYKKTNITSVGLRMAFVENSFEAIKKHTILGTGTGSFKKEFANVHSNLHFAVPNPHNEYLYIMVQFGVVGLLILLTLFLVPLWYGRYLPVKYTYIVNGVIVGIMVGSLANSWLLDVTEGNFFAYFLVLAFAAWSIPRSGLEKENNMI